MADTPEMLPEARELLDSQRKTWAGLTSIAEKRRAWSAYAASLSRPPPESLAVSDRSVPSPDGSVPIRLYRPRAEQAPLPCMIYMHGGGFMMGDLDSSDSIA
jgi:acetyl esterase